MKFSKASAPGLWLVELDLREDERGFLARTYCETEFAEHGLNTRWPQCNLTLTNKRGMIRGLHFQGEPKPEIKLIRCAAGAIFDVLVDVRRDSPAFGRWEGFELTAVLNWRAACVGTIRKWTSNGPFQTRVYPNVTKTFRYSVMELRLRVEPYRRDP